MDKWIFCFSIMLLQWLGAFTQVPNHFVSTSQGVSIRIDSSISATRLFYNFNSYYGSNLVTKDGRTMLYTRGNNLYDSSGVFIDSLQVSDTVYSVGKHFIMYSQNDSNHVLWVYYFSYYPPYDSNSGLYYDVMEISPVKKIVSRLHPLKQMPHSPLCFEVYTNNTGGIELFLKVESDSLYNYKLINSTFILQGISVTKSVAGRYLILKPNHKFTHFYAIEESNISTFAYLNEYRWDSTIHQLFFTRVVDSFDQYLNPRISSLLYGNAQYRVIEFSPDDKLLYMLFNCYDRTCSYLKCIELATNKRKEIPLSNLARPFYNLFLASNGKLYVMGDNQYISCVGNLNRIEKLRVTKDFELFTNISYYTSRFTYFTERYKKLYYKQQFRCDTLVCQNESDTSFFGYFEWHITNLRTNKFTKVVSKNLFLPIHKNDSFFILLVGKAQNSNYTAYYDEDIDLSYIPKASFTMQSTVGCQYVSFQFNSNSTTDTLAPGGYSYFWDFGDGITMVKNSLTPVSQFNHTYTQSGTFQVRLVFSNGFCTDTFIYSNNVTILPAPKPGFTVTPVGSFCSVPVSVVLSSLTTTNVARYYFDLGNGDTLSSIQSTINYTYTRAGTFIIHQHVLGITGCITEDSLKLEIHQGLKNADTPTVLFTTVLDDNTTKTVWKAMPSAAYYSINNKNIPDTFYVDKQALPYQQVQKYIIKGVDSCGNLSTSALVAQTIYLRAENTHFNEYTVLQYTPYETWKNGVLHYRIEYFNEKTKNWDSIAGSAPGTYSKNVDALPGESTQVNTGEICYRIIAIENGGNGQQSISNKACIKIYPVVFIPNAFSPNKDGINDYFKPVAAGLTTYIFEIYDRWGQRVYSDTPESPGWDGTFRGEALPAGEYVYRLSAVGYRKSPSTSDAGTIERKGMLLLVR